MSLRQITEAKASGNKIAIIGCACKFPDGSDNPEHYFQNLLTGRNYVSKIPMDRWSSSKFYNPDDASGKAYVQSGHFLHHYDFRSFDADFFSFSPREVEFLDPQQRILLELSWEAMESAGLNPEALAGSNTGVFVGGFTVDHLLNQFGTGARDNIGSHSAAGATLTMLSNRISYAFDFRGPSFSVDTACSSSLVAFAQAVTAIKSDQCEVALVGGVNFMLRPEYTVAMSKGRFLAKDGRSKSFDARADGYGRGEGGGMVVLKDLAAAERDGDPILAIVDGVGVNQDGRTSGITVPNPQAQQDLMNKVLIESGCSADDITYVEAHGTGTAVGNPLETKAIAEVYGRGGHCRVGSVKASIGHLEAAAGIASVIKSVMMLKHNIIPPVAGLEEINPAIPDSIALPRQPIPLHDLNLPTKIAINSFGYGGTNAHLILGTPTTSISAGKTGSETPDKSERLLPITARDADALRARSEQFLHLLESDTVDLDDLLYTASRRRSHLSHRLAVWGSSKQALKTALRDHLDGNTPEGCASGERMSQGQADVVFIYTGMGPQWHGMGRELFQDNAVFRDTLTKADQVFQTIAGFSILDEMLRDEEESQIKRTEFAQPANLMLQMGLTAVLKAEGILPAAVVGHSVGEVASAWASGMLSLEDALRVSCYRSRIQATTAGMGKMLAVGLSEADAAELIAPYGELVSLAAINSPSSVTVAGDADSLEAIQTLATERKVFAKMLDVAVPYHSPVMEQLKPELRTQLASLEPQAPAIPLYSTVTGSRTGHTVNSRFFDAEYWCDNVRDPVHFADAVRSLLSDGYTLFVEVGPHPVLRRAIEEVFKEQNADAKVISTLRMQKPELPAVKQAIADVFTSGGQLDWSLREPRGQLISLPTYPWQRKTLWRESLWQAKDRLESPADPLCDVNGIDLNLMRLNYLFDHKVDGASIMPAAGFLEALCQKARQHWPQTSEQSGWSLQDIGIHEALILDRDRPTRLHVEFDEFTSTAKLIATDAQSDKSPLLHADANMYPLTASQRPTMNDKVLNGFEGETVAIENLYEELRELSLQYGPAFQSIIALIRNRAQGEVLATLQRPDSAGEDTSAYLLHPSLLDGCFQSALSLMENRDGAYLPVSLDSLQVYGSAEERILCHTRIISKDAGRIVCDFDLADEAGNVFAAIRGLHCIAMRGKSAADSVPRGDYQRMWNPVAPVEKVDRNAGLFVIVANPADRLADALAEVSQSVGTPCQRVEFGELRNGLANPDSPLRATTHLAVIPDSEVGGDLFGERDPTGQNAVEDLLLLVQDLVRTQIHCKLRVITKQAASILAQEPVNPSHTALAGFVRVVRNEQASLNAAVIDTTQEEDLFHQAQCLFVEILNSDSIDEIALRNGQRYAVELTRSEALSHVHTARLSDLDQVAVKIEKVGTDFKANILHEDGSNSADAYQIKVSRLAFHPNDNTFIGISGVIVQAGENCTRFTSGDHVCGLVSCQPGSRLSVKEADSILVKADPSSQTSLPAMMAVMEARAALIEQSCGELENARILVDSSMLGEALGRRLTRRGATVVSFDQFTRESNATPLHRFDLMAGPLALWSRNLGFKCLQAGGTLVDLNEQQASFPIPSHCGQFIRLPHDMAGLKKNKRFPEVLASVIEEALAGQVHQYKPWDISQVLESGWNQHPSDHHKTKWQEVSFNADQTAFDALLPVTPRFSSNGTYLVTGGFGGLGAQLAQWLAANGAGHVALVSRRGVATPGAKDLMQSLRDKGAEVRGYAVDMADAAAVHQLMQTLCSGNSPLKGVFHAAGVLEDKLIAHLTPNDISKVMSVKAGGAHKLHHCLQDLKHEVEHFVLFSSIANLVGNSRQANYCAANGYLDGLAHHRRSLGLPGLSINFGAIDEVGMLDGDARVGQHLTQIGLAPLNVDVALRGVGIAMMQNQTQVAVAEQIAWERWAAYETVGGISPAFSKLVAESREAQSGDASLIEQLHHAVLTLAEEDGREALRALITEVIALALKTTPDRLKPDLAFDAFGVDSLMSTEIQIQLDQSIGINYAVVELLGHSTINSLVDKAFNEITNTQEA